MDYYKLEVCGLKRDLPIIQISDNFKIASFVLLGDAELAEKAGIELSKKVDADIILTAEAKGISLAHEIAKNIGEKSFVVARKSEKSYMNHPINVEVNSITTKNTQKLYLDSKDVEKVKGKKIALVDDVISTGESMNALESLVKKAGGEVVQKLAILAEGDAANRDDIIFLEKLPIFEI
ncbi:phosphoribosyltransferase family protein [Anaerococcus hydrogenalis]|uniref:Adenine phosphoribosyltransferase n=1 Tax=Anaerococcus hydrogenalis TaxID=33029 RepID=A0A2N6UK44_9FIRM|nr:phosphoribosyltransferase family protein [Anaerococcus hydrogenalis]MDK7694101.1 phosphoribosyltransferase family protein [Anaerococcus hydrogenalis]MDK7695879.1 phosphoribosyltransferase family protein [Anaerococcus hydrogenalis]MDK7707128.1 phosphoribosyltransferase family protein [Anaerococcus hydrogenalis]PMC82156.1 adenine phosphoribosyltransferase [Anaerococcus hydrogenalis]